MNTVKNTLSDTAVMYGLIILVGTVYYGSWTLFSVSVLLSFAIGSIISTTAHDGWAHNYIIPKNKVIQFVLDFLVYLTVLPLQKTLSPRIIWRYLHVLHHRNWKGTDDGTQWNVDNNSWARYVFTTKLRSLGPRVITKEILEQETARYKSTLNRPLQLLDENYFIIIPIFHLLCIAVLGIELYLYCVLAPLWALVRLMLIFGDVIPHKGKLSRDEETDLGWWWLGGTIAYHASHHRYINHIKFGDGWRRYFDVSYYLIKWCFNVSPNVKLVY